MENDQLTQEDLQGIWNEEAVKLDAGEQPAEEPVAAAPETPQEQPETQQAPEEQAADPLAGLPEEVKAALAKIPQLEQANAQLLHHVKTAEGRVAAMQREFQQAKAAQTAVAPQEAPSQGQIATAAKNPEKWQQLKQDFPEWADAMEEFVAAKLGSLTPSQPGLDPKVVEAYVQQQVKQTRAEMQQALEEARVEGKHENWRETVKSPDFQAWFALQPPDTQALANSPLARDAIRMLDMFQTTRSRSASDILQERGARLAAAATTRPGQTPPPKTMDDMSLSDLWNYEAKQREKTRADRGF